MRRWAGIAALIVSAGVAPGMAQPFPAAETPTPQQLRGRNATLASATGRYCCKSRRGVAWAQQSNRNEQTFESTLRIAG